MNRIAVNRQAGRVWYEDFASFVEDLTTGGNTYVNAYNGKTGNRLEYYIADVILYNVRYRDILRARGIDALMAVLFDEAPAFREEPRAIWHLRETLEGRGTIGAYDIQCLSVDDCFSVHGRTYRGLDDVRADIEWYMRPRWDPFMAQADGRRPGDVRILCDHEPYPIFDSSDWFDDRYYCNYFFKKGCFGDSDFRRISGIPYDSNFCKAHERLGSVEETPILYYQGDGASMLLVTPHYVPVRQETEETKHLMSAGPSNR